MDKEGHTEAALRVFRRNLWKPEDGQEGAKLWEKPDRLDQVQVPTKDAAVQAEGLGRYAIPILMELISQTFLRVEIIHRWVVQDGDGQMMSHPQDQEWPSKMDYCLKVSSTNGR